MSGRVKGRKHSGRTRRAMQQVAGSARPSRFLSRAEVARVVRERTDFELSADRLRKWEGVVVGVPDPEKYDREAVAAVEFVARLMTFGVSLQAVRKFARHVMAAEHSGLVRLAMRGGSK